MYLDSLGGPHGALPKGAATGEAAGQRRDGYVVTAALLGLEER
jgi:hypothetical protein